MFKCACNSIPKKGDHFCRNCGADVLQSDSFLCECGSEVNKEDSFCHACGVAFEGIEDEEEFLTKETSCSTCGSSSHF